MRKKTAKYRNSIKNDLLAQLSARGNTGKYYLDLVDDYMQLWGIKNDLFADIADRGVVTSYDNGGGQRGTKQNDSVCSVLKVSDRMTRILNELGIKPSAAGNFDNMGEGDEVDL